MPAEIRVAVSPGEIRTALLLDGRLEAAWVERPARPDGVGDLHRGRVAAVSAAMSGAFLELAGGETGFLPASEVPGERQPIHRALQEGQALRVRVSRAAQGGKGPRLTARLDPGELAVPAPVAGGPALLARGPAAALRLAAAWPAATVGVDSAAQAATLRAALGRDRVSLVPRAFDPDLEEVFDSLAEPGWALPGGGRLSIHPTPALTAIDIDAGSLAGGRDAAAHAAMNDAALAEAARQIRLRNLAGAILIDPAGMPAKARAALLPGLKRAIAPDSLLRLVGLTGLGLIELQRQRLHPPLHEVLGAPPTPLTQGLRALRAASREAAARPAARLALRAAPPVLAALAGLPGALAEYETGAGRPLRLIPDPSLAPDGTLITDAD
jgi:ribonuclease G